MEKKLVCFEKPNPLRVQGSGRRSCPRDHTCSRLPSANTGKGTPTQVIIQSTGDESFLFRSQMKRSEIYSSCTMKIHVLYFKRMMHQRLKGSKASRIVTEYFSLINMFSFSGGSMSFFWLPLPKFSDPCCTIAYFLEILELFFFKNHVR